MTLFVLALVGSSALAQLPAAQVAAAHGPAGPAHVVEVRVERSRDRQMIEGFGGSLAYWGYDADEAALRVAFGELGASIVRVPGEVAQSGNAEAYCAALERVTRIAPEAGILVTFWQPRSKARPRPEDWLDVDSAKKYRLKPTLAGAWADEMVERVRLIRRDWGAHVVAVAVQNEPNFSVPGTQTCAWEPDRLADFLIHEFAPRLAAARLGEIAIAAPELAYISEQATEARRFALVLAGPAASIFSYHMYDSYKHGTGDPGLDGATARQRALGQFLRESLPTKRVWMTETTGAQYNGAEWHTLGWSPGLDEHDKAMAAARYMHAAVVDAGAGAFLWWGLIYSEAPERITGAEERQKFRDEGLILVKANKEHGVHAFLERTPKSYTFQHFSRFVRPGWVRVDLSEPVAGNRGRPLASAFRSPDGREAVVVLIHPGKAASAPVDLRVTGNYPYRLDRAVVTDRARHCQPFEWTGILPPESVATLVFRAEMQ